LRHARRNMESSHAANIPEEGSAAPRVPQTGRGPFRFLA
jgi:hypothetical protein